MYNDPVQALRAAYRAMAIDTTVTTQLWNDMSGGVVQDKTDLNKFDRIAQGVFTLSLAEKSARLYTRYLLRAVYYPPTPDFRGQKALSGKMVSQYVYELLNKRIDRWFIDDITRKYIGLQQRHDEKWWSDHLSRTDRQIRRYKNKIMPVLDGLHDSLIMDIEPVFIENKIISNP